MDWEEMYGKNVTIENQLYLTFFLPKCQSYDLVFPLFADVDKEANAATSRNLN